MPNGYLKVEKKGRWRIGREGEAEWEEGRGREEGRNSGREESSLKKKK